jgi:hypothetical protein
MFLQNVGSYTDAISQKMAIFDFVCSPYGTTLQICLILEEAGLKSWQLHGTS